MYDLVDGIDSLDVVDNDTKTETEEPSEDVVPEASTSGEVDGDSVSRYSYLGRVLPALIVQHGDWGNAEFYEALSSRKDFPTDGSVTKVNLRKKVSKLRKKMKSNGGFLLDPYDNTQKLRANGEPFNEESETSECGKLPSTSNPVEGCSLKSILGLAQTMAPVWCGCGYSGIVKEKGLADGTASWIQEMSSYITMLRSVDGKEAARLFISAVFWDKESVFQAIPEWVRDRMFGWSKTSVGITNEDVELWEAIKTSDCKKAKSILENLVNLDEERVKTGKSQGKSLPYLQLASMYLNGTGMECDVKRAESLYRIAAERGNSIAQHKLAYLAEQRGVKGKALMDMYRIGVENENADSMNNLAVELLKQPGKTISNNREIRNLLNRGVELNTSRWCKETYVKEILATGDADNGLRLAWDLIVAGESARAGFLAGTQYLLKENKRFNKRFYNLKLGDALLRLSAAKGCDAAHQFLPRVQALRMKEERARYRSEIPAGYVQEQTEWEMAKDLMVNDLIDSFQELLSERLEECFLEISHQRDG